MLSNEINIYSPIISGESLGGLKLGTHIKDIYDLVFNIAMSNDGPGKLVSGFYAYYSIPNIFTASFHVLNGKLITLSALEGYKGQAFGKISVGSKLNEVYQLHSDTLYDDFEETHVIPHLKGINFATATPELSITEDPNQIITEITVHIPELLEWNKARELGDW